MEVIVQTKSWSHPSLCTVLVNLLRVLEVEEMGAKGITEERVGSGKGEQVMGFKSLALEKDSRSVTRRGRLRISQVVEDDKGN